MTSGASAYDTSDLPWRGAVTRSPFARERPLCAVEEVDELAERPGGARGMESVPQAHY
jgi:hypothetical protein